MYLGPRAQAILRERLRTELHAPRFQPVDAEQWRRAQQHAKRTTPLSCGNRPGSNRKSKPRKSPGSAYTTGSYLRAVKYTIERCNRDRKEEGLPEISAWHPHQLRHNAATLYRREHGLEVARVLLGHKTASITEIYAEADKERAVEGMAKIG